MLSCCRTSSPRVMNGTTITRSASVRNFAAGMTIDDYGFGIVRRDGRTPRPVCEWLLREQVNRAIRSESAYEADIRFRPPENRVPVGYDYSRQGDELIIRRVKIDKRLPNANPVEGGRTAIRCPEDDRKIGDRKMFLSAYRTNPFAIPRRITNPSYGQMWLFRFQVRSCHPERSEGSPLPVK